MPLKTCGEKNDKSPGTWAKITNEFAVIPQSGFKNIIKKKDKYESLKKKK